MTHGDNRLIAIRTSRAHVFKKRANIKNDDCFLGVSLFACSGRRDLYMSHAITEDMEQYLFFFLGEGVVEREREGKRMIISVTE